MYVQKKNFNRYFLGVFWQISVKEKLRHINRCMYMSFTKIQILNNQTLYIYTTTTGYKYTIKRRYCKKIIFP